MNTPKKSTIEVRGTAITVLSTKDDDFISLTDMLKAKDGANNSSYVTDPPWTNFPPVSTAPRPLISACSFHPNSP